MQMHSVTQRIPQQHTGKHKTKLFIPDCPSQINYSNKFNKMLSLSVNIKRSRYRMNNKTVNKQNSDEVLNLTNDFCSFCIKSKQYERASNILPFGNANSQSVAKSTNFNENLKSFSCLTPTHRYINMQTTKKEIATSGQSNPYTCTTTNATYAPTNTIFNQTKLLSSNINTNKSKNLLHINYGQEKLVYASIKNSNNKNKHVRISKEGKTTRSGKSDTRFTQHIRIQQSIATRFKNLLISFKCCKKVGMAPITCLLIIIFFLSTHSQIVKSQDIELTTTTTTTTNTRNNLINNNEVEINNNHMTAIKNMANLLSLNLRNSKRVTNNDEVNSLKKSNNLLTKLAATQIENYNNYKMLSKNTPNELFNSQINSESMTKNSIPQNYHNHLQQLQPVIEYLNSGELEEFDSATDESIADTDIQRNNLSKDNNSDTLEVLADWPRMKPVISESDNQKLLKLVIDGLGLKKLPDMRKVIINRNKIIQTHH